VGQFEQEITARVVDAMGVGRYLPAITADGLNAFARDAPEFAQRVGVLPAPDNEALFATLDETISSLSGGVRSRITGV
jgi:hypothetical protein